MAKEKIYTLDFDAVIESNEIVSIIGVFKTKRDRGDAIRRAMRDIKKQLMADTVFYDANSAECMMIEVRITKGTLKAITKGMEL